MRSGAWDPGTSSGSGTTGSEDGHARGGGGLSQGWHARSAHRIVSFGTLVLVGTPIGNLGDLAPRAVEVLASADLLACEDTRRTRQLLTYCGISAAGRLVSLHEHNEARRIPELLDRLARGETVAVVSDAGMPGVSDPGSRLVASAVEAGHTVTVVPGPSAAMAALVVSGLPTRSFCFEGFLPRKGRLRRELLDEIATGRRTTVLFESPYRVAATVSDLEDACGGDRRVAIVRELTKVYEEVWRGTLGEAVSRYGEIAARGTAPKGEHVIVVEGTQPSRNRPKDVCTRSGGEGPPPG